MSFSPRDIKRRMKAIKSTKQVTRTMQMIAASKMRRAQQQVLQTRFYAQKALEILMQLPERGAELRHPLLAKREVQKTTIILFTSQRGLCGGFNSNLVRMVLQKIKDLPKESVSFITVGKKGRDMVIRSGYKVEADFSHLPDNVDFLTIYPVAAMILAQYEAKETDKVYLAYTHYASAVALKPIFQPLLPIAPENLLKLAKGLAGEEKKNLEKNFEFVFEPSPAEVLKSMLPRLTEMQVFQAILESKASEHSARMIAMKNATDAAGDIIDSLSLIYNKARQGAITSEIAEISAGADASKTVEE